MVSKLKNETLKHLRNSVKENIRSDYGCVHIDRDQSVNNREIDDFGKDFGYNTQSNRAELLKEYPNKNKKYTIGLFLNIYTTTEMKDDGDIISPGYNIQSLFTNQTTRKNKNTDHGLIDREIIENSPRKYLIHVDKHDLDDGVEYEIYYIILDTFRRKTDEYNVIYPRKSNEEKIKVRKSDPGVYGLDKMLERIERNVGGSE